jgi:sulfate adenylyltransferase subunit 2
VTAVVPPRSVLPTLECASIAILREAAAEARNPVLLYSAGKDSSVLLHLAAKAFAPAPIPFPVLHVNTGWKPRELIAFRDHVVATVGVRFLEWINAEGAARGIDPFQHGARAYTAVMKTEALKQALAHHGFDFAIGGARRDEERSRAKERVWSHRDANQRWDPRRQRPEPWGACNPRLRPGESLRVFPLSDWTELDVWAYIEQERIPVAPLYFAAPRPVVERRGAWILAEDQRLPLAPGELPVERSVRFRTLGCWPLTAAIESRAASIADILAEMAAARRSERAGRLIDGDDGGSIEELKRDGYF